MRIRRNNTKAIQNIYTESASVISAVASEMALERYTFSEEKVMFKLSSKGVQSKKKRTQQYSKTIPFMEDNH